MAHLLADRVRETTTSTGTGTITLAGAYSPTNRTFASVYSIGDTFPYSIVSRTGSDWETGLGTYSALNTITRTTITGSSNAGSAVNFSAGTKDVFVGPIASTLGLATVPTTKGGTGLTTIGTANQVLAVNGSATALTYTTITSNPGTVTSVSGTGTVNGITLSGTVTSSGNLTLGGALSSVSLTTQVTGTLPVANGGTGVTTSTGTGSVVLSTAPTLTTPLTNSISAVPVGSGAGNSLTISAGSGITSGAGGSLYFHPGAQAVAGGYGAMVVTNPDTTGISNSPVFAARFADSNLSYQIAMTVCYPGKTGLWLTGANALYAGCTGVNNSDGGAMVSSTQISIRGDSGKIGFPASTDPSGAVDSYFTRDAAGTLAQRNGTNAQTFRLYNTYTNSTNYERLGLTWASNTCTIGVEQAQATGTATVTAASGNGTTITYTASNSFLAGQTVSVTGLTTTTGTTLNIAAMTIQNASSTQFTVANTTVGTAVATQTGTATLSKAGRDLTITAGNGVTSGAGGNLILQAGTQTVTGGDGKVIVKQASGQTSNLQEWQNNSTTILAYVAANGRISADNGISFASATTAISTSQNNFALPSSAFQRLNCSAASSITGIAPPSGGSHVDGRMIRIYNVGTANLTLSHNSGSSTAGNKLWCSTAADIILAPNDYAELIYDSTDNGSTAAGWRVS